MTTVERRWGAWVLIVSGLFLTANGQSQVYGQDQQSPYTQTPNTPGTDTPPPGYPRTRPSGYPSNYPSNYPAGYNRPYPQPTLVPAFTAITPESEATPAVPIPAPPPGAAQYQEPKLVPKPFDPEKTGLTAEQKTEIATQLAQVVRLIAFKDPKPPYPLATKALGIALCLEPENRTAVIVNLQFSKNVHFENVAPEPSAPSVAQNIFKLAQTLKDQSEPDARKLRGYLIDLAHEIDPPNEDLIYEQEMFRRKEGGADWSSILANSAKPGGAPAKAVARQLSIHCLMVSELGSGEMAGSAMNLTATVTPRENSRPSRIQVAGTLGKDMLTSFQETERAVRAQGSPLPEGADITLSFAEKYSAKDGPSASAALGLLLMGIADEIQIDPLFAITGDMNVDGSIHAIGGVNAKIRGASNANCSRMAIPEENLRDLEDMAILGELSTLWKAQIFTVKNLKEASLLAAKDPDPELAKGIAAFAELQEICRKNPPGTFFPTPIIRQKLAETLAAAPNHASALILQRSIDKKLPKTLSLRTSINEIFNAASPFFEFLYRTSGNQSSQRSAFAFAPDVYDKATDRLFFLTPQIDPLAMNLHSETNDMVRNWRTASKRTYSPVEIQRLIDAANKVDSSIKRMREDHQVQETLSN